MLIFRVWGNGSPFRRSDLGFPNLADRWVWQIHFAGTPFPYLGKKAEAPKRQQQFFRERTSEENRQLIKLDKNTF